jgi:hypothetical protein
MITDILPILTAALIVALFLGCLRWYNKRHPRKVIGPVRDPDDHSRKVLFHKDELVKDKRDVYSGVGRVTENTGSSLKGEPEVCWVDFGGDWIIPCPMWEGDLRHLTRWEFFLHKLPNGQWMMGNNSYPFVLIGACIALISGSVYCVYDHTGWWALPLHVVTIGYPVMLWRQTDANYHGKQG